MITISADGAIALDRIPTGFRVIRDADMMVVRRGMTTLSLMFSQYDLDIRSTGPSLSTRERSDVRDIRMFTVHFKDALLRYCNRTSKRLESPDFARAREIVRTTSLERIMEMDPRTMDVPLSSTQLQIAKEAAQNARFLREYTAAGHSITELAVVAPTA